MIRMNVFACTIFLILLSFSAVSAKNLYVDKNHSKASNNNAGTSASYPLKTIQKAVDLAAAGDVVLVKAGYYYESVTLKRSGTSSAPITIKAYDPNNRPVIDGSSISATRLFYWGSSPRHYIILDGFVIRNGKKWAVWAYGNRNIIRNCDVYNFPGSGINIITGDYNVIANNKVYNIGNASKGWIGNNINIESDPDQGKTANYNIVENNVIYNNDSHFGVNIFPNAAYNAKQAYMKGNIIRGNNINKCLGGIYTRYQTNFAYYNNVVTNSLDNGIWLHFHSNGPSSMKNFTAYGKIYNNTIVGSENVGLFNATSNSLDIRNNIFYNNGRTETGGMEHIRMDRTSSHIIENNLYHGRGRWRWAGTIIRTFSDWKSKTNKDKYSLNVDPKFKSLGDLDLQVTGYSPAINGGANFGSPYNTDLKGTARPKYNRSDMGAYEFTGTVYKTADNETAEVPEVFEMSQNYPNPFNPSTTIKYSVPENSMVTLKVYDILGAEVATLVNDIKAAGKYEVNFDASRLSSGTYIYRITSKNFVQTKKMMLVK